MRAVMTTAPRPYVAALLALMLALAACRKDDAHAVDAGRPIVSASAAPSAPTVADAGSSEPPRERRPAPAAHAQALRRRLAQLEDEPALAANAKDLRAHFGDRLPPALAVQSVALTERSARALVVSDATKGAAESAPLVLVVDGPAHRLRWTKERPTAGIVAPVGPFAVASGPRGRVVLAICDPPTRRVALRLWDADGSPFADFDVMDVEDCTTLAALYWPERGWLVVATRPGQTRAQLVSEEGQLRWQRGTDLGARSRTGAAVALAQDGDVWELVQAGAAPDTARADQAYAFRYDGKPTELHPPVPLGAMPREVWALEPLAIDRTRPGVFRVKLGARAIDLGPSGVLGP